jgi:peptidylprolyl isomerase
MKFRPLVAAVATAALAIGIAQAQNAPAPAAPAANNAPIDRNTLSYALGYQYGRELADRNVQLDVNTLIRAVQDGFAKRNPTVAEAQLIDALQRFQQQMQTQARAEFERVSSENRTRSQAFLASNRSRPGVVTLPSGIQYRIIENGTGARPTLNNEVQMHFRASLPDGTELRSTYAQPQPMTVPKVSELPLTGLREILTMMPAGSRWEVFLPADKAYGDDPRSPIGPAQVVIYDIKLVGVR